MSFTFDNPPPIVTPEQKLHNLEQKKGISWEKSDLNIQSFPFNENNFFRIINIAGFLDYLENDIVRSSPTGTEENIIQGINLGGRPTSFPSFDKSKPDITYLKNDEDNYIIESNIQMYRSSDMNPVTNTKIGGRHWAYRPIDEQGKVVKQLENEHVSAVYKVDKQGKFFTMIQTS